MSVVGCTPYAAGRRLSALGVAMAEAGRGGGRKGGGSAHALHVQLLANFDDAGHAGRDLFGVLGIIQVLGRQAAKAGDAAVHVDVDVKRGGGGVLAQLAADGVGDRFVPDGTVRGAVTTSMESMELSWRPPITSREVPTGLVGGTKTASPSETRSSSMAEVGPEADQPSVRLVSRDWSWKSPASRDSSSKWECRRGRPAGPGPK